MGIEIKSLKDISKNLRQLYDVGTKAADQKNYAYAIDMYRTVLRKEPGLSEVRDRLRDAQLKKIGGKAGLGRQLLAGIIGIPNFVKGPLLTSKEEYSQALDNGEAAMSVDPTAPWCCSLLAKAAFEAELLEVGITTLEFCHQHNPKHVGTLNWLATVYSEQGRGKKSLECIVKIRELMPNNKHYEERLKEATAEAAMDQGGWTKAERDEADYKDLIKDKDQAAALEQQGKTFLDKSDVAGNIERLVAEIAEKPTVQSVRTLAELYHQVGEYDKAIETYEQVNEVAGTMDPAVDEAITKILAQQFDDGIKEWQDYLKDDISDEERENAEGTIASIEEQKRHMMLERIGEQVRRYPNSVPARFRLANLQLENNDLDEALSNFQVAQKNPQYKQQATLSMAKCFMQKGQHDLAVGQLSTALDGMHSMNDLKKETLYTMGQCYDELGRTDDAAEAFKAIYAVDLNFRDVAQIIERIYKEQGGES